MVILSTDFHRFMECVGVSALWYLSHCGIVPLWGLIRLLSGFPPQILYSHCGVKPSGSCVNFSTHVQYHAPLRHGIVGTRKPSPRTFIGQWAGGAYPTLCIVGMVVCLFVGIVSHLPTLLLYKMVGENPMKKYVLIFFNIFF